MQTSVNIYYFMHLLYVCNTSFLHPRENVTWKYYQNLILLLLSLHLLISFRASRHTMSSSATWSILKSPLPPRDTFFTMDHICHVIQQERASGPAAYMTLRDQLIRHATGPDQVTTDRRCAADNVAINGSLFRPRESLRYANRRWRGAAARGLKGWLREVKKGTACVRGVTATRYSPDSCYCSGDGSAVAALCKLFGEADGEGSPICTFERREESPWLSTANELCRWTFPFHVNGKCTAGIELLITRNVEEMIKNTTDNHKVCHAACHIACANTIPRKQRNVIFLGLGCICDCNRHYT